MNALQKVTTKRRLKRNNEILPKTKVHQEDSIDEGEYPIYNNEKTDNFESLLQSPVCNSFFKLKSEQKWDNERNSDSLCYYFKLNLERLNAGVNCLAISKRHDIPELCDSNYFDKKQSIYIQKYKNYCDQYKKGKKDKLDENNKNAAEHINPTKEIMDDKSVETDQSMGKEHEIKDSLNACEDDLEELLHLTVSETVEDQIIAEDPLLETKMAIVKMSTQSTDLEDWLDDILDN